MSDVDPGQPALNAGVDPLLEDEDFIDEILAVGQAALDQAKHYPGGENTTIFECPRLHAEWLQTHGYTKQFAKWVAPVYAGSGIWHHINAVYGKQASPIPDLGDRTITGLIRTLIFDHHLGKEAAITALVEKLGCPYGQAAPAVCRVFANVPKSKSQHTKDADYSDVVESMEME